MPISSCHYKFKVALQGGIGDIIRILSSIPLQQYNRKYGLKIYVTYGSKNDCKYEELLKRYIINRIDVFEYVTYEQFVNLDIPEMFVDNIDLKEFSSQLDGIPKDLPIDILDEEKSSLISLDGNKINIGIQLRQNGSSGDNRKLLDSKILSFDKYQKIIDHILSLDDNIVVYLFDRTEPVFQFEPKERIVGFYTGVLPKAIDLIRKMDLFISPDSWMKYVAYWEDIPQVVLVNKVDNVDDSVIVNGCLPGFFGREHIRIIGENNKCLLYNDINDIPVENIFDAISDLFSRCLQHNNIEQQTINREELSNLLNRQQFAVLTYAPIGGKINIGDSIQSFATMELLRQFGYRGDFLYANRNHISELVNECVLIANGYFSGWDGDYSTWNDDFPLPDHITPIYTSMHLDKGCEFSKVISDHFIKYSPIGTRDRWSMKKLVDIGIPSYFSRDLVLTLQNRFDSRNNNIYIVDVPDVFLNYIPEEITSRATRISHCYHRSKGRTNEEYELDQWNRCRWLIDTYGQASLVVTSRIHAACPCIAQKTPVVLLCKHEGDWGRIGSLCELIPIYTIDDVRNNKVDWHPCSVVDIDDYKQKIMDDFINHLLRVINMH